MDEFLVAHPKPYFCSDCEVYGWGLDCWLCGGDKAMRWGQSPKWTCMSRVDASVELEPDSSPPLLQDWSTPYIDPMTLYADTHGVPI